MEQNIQKQIIWSLGVFALIFFWTNVIWDYSGELVHKIVGSKMAAVAEVAIEEDNLPAPMAIGAGTDRHLTVAFVGDIMMDRGVKSSTYKNFNGDYAELFSKVREQLNSYDLLIGNLEGPASDKGSDQGGIYSFRMEPVVIPILKNVGFDGFSLANNHILNYGQEALDDTKVRLHEGALLVMGEKNIILNGISIIFLPYNQFTSLDIDQIKKEISLAKMNNDLVVTYFHFGEEYETQPNEYQKNVAKVAIDSGADLVVGAHPHVVQTLEQYKNTYIAYSLGNFIFDQYFSPETMWGGLLEVEINLASKQIEKVELKKVIFNKYFQIEEIK